MPWLAPIRPHTSLAYNAHAASRSEQCRWQRLYHPQQKIPENSGFALPNNAGRSACRQADFICAHLWEPLPPVGIVAQLKLCRLLSPPPTQLLPPPPPHLLQPCCAPTGLPHRPRRRRCPPGRLRRPPASEAGLQPSFAALFHCCCRLYPKPHNPHHRHGPHQVLFFAQRLLRLPSRQPVRSGKRETVWGVEQENNRGFCYYFPWGKYGRR